MSAAGRDFLLPDLGEGLTSAEIVAWLVGVGDEVAVDQPVAEVETAKAVVEVPCPFPGRVGTLHGAAGDTVEVGTPLISIVAATAATAAAGAPGSAAAAEASTPVPSEGFSEPGVVVPRSRGPVENGRDGNGAAPEHSGSGAVLVGYGTSEGTRRLRRGRRPLAMDGSRTMASRTPSDPVPSGPTAPAAPGPGEANAPSARTAPPPAADGRRVAVVSPLVRRIARENGVDVAAVRGTGERGLVLRRDVLAAVAARAEHRDAGTGNGLAGAASTGAAAPPQPQSQGPDEVRRIPLRGAQRTMAETLSRSRREIPEATVWVDTDATGLVELRRTLNEADPEHPVSLLALLARFCVQGLRRYPALNSQVDTDRAEIVRHSRINLGFAAQTPRGLVVPVVHDAQTMSTRALSAALSAATDDARNGRLTPARLTGGTFTVNNYGVFGVDGSAAIINHPQAAIVGMGRIVKRAWVVGDELAVRPVTELTLAFDHRVCDGEVAGGFLRFVADCVERPALLIGDL